MADLTGGLADLEVSLVGPGRVGTSLAWWLASAGARVRLVVARQLESAAAVATELGARAVRLDGDLELGGDLVIVGVADAAIGEVARQLAPRCRARFVVHLAGRLGPSALAPLASRTQLGCLHPLRAFPEVERSPNAARGILFAVDGPSPWLALANRIGDALGAEVAQVPEAARDSYHLAATVAAGGTASLLVAAIELGRRLGLGPEVARGYCRLAAGALEAVASRAPGDVAKAVTGPAVRGELALVERLEHLSGREPQLAEVATMAALAGVLVVGQSVALDPRVEELERALRVLLERFGRNRSSD